MRVVVRSIPTAPKIHERALPIIAILEDLERYGETAGMDDDGTLRIR